MPTGFVARRDPRAESIKAGGGGDRCTGARSDLPPMPRRSQEDNEFERFRRQRQRDRLQRGNSSAGFGGIGGFGSGQQAFGGGQDAFGNGQFGYGGGQPGYGGGQPGYGGGDDVFGGAQDIFASGQPAAPIRGAPRGDSQETRDQRISNDVRDFFEEATRQARTIVERVARGAAAEPAKNVEREVELFLLDAVERMNDFVVGRLTLDGASGDERDFAPTLSNIVGDQLDEFREAGTASTDDKHVGKDPFLVNVQEVQRAFRERIASLRATDEPPQAAPDSVSMVDVDDDDGVAAEYDEGQELDPPPTPTRPKARAGAVAVASPAVAAPESVDQAMAPAEDVASPAPAEVAPVATAAAAAAQDSVAAVEPEAAPPEAAPPAAKPAHDLVALARLKQALKAMVGSGTMTREEAIAVWRKRVGEG